MNLLLPNWMPKLWIFFKNLYSSKNQSIVVKSLDMHRHLLKGLLSVKDGNN